MLIQILIVVLFALNLAFFWLAQARGLAWYRYPGSVVLVLLPLAGVFFSQPLFELDFAWWRVAGGASMVLGVMLIGWTFRLAGLLLPLSEPGKLRTDGPFALVRHPVYLGLIFFFVGWWWAWAAVYSFYFGMIILLLIWVNAYLEERLLLEKALGARYAEYKGQTGMFWIK